MSCYMTIMLHIKPCISRVYYIFYMFWLQLTISWGIILKHKQLHSYDIYRYQVTKPQ